MALWKLAWHYSKKYWPWVLGVMVLQLISILATLALPGINAEIIDRGITGGDIGLIWQLGGVMMAICFAQLVAAVLAVYCGSKVATSVGADMRRDIYRKVDSLGSLDISKFGAATLITRNTNDVQQVQQVIVLALNMMIPAPIMSIGGIIAALRQDINLSWLVWVSVGVLAVVVGIMVYFLVPLFRTVQDKIDKINGVLRDQIIGIRVIRAFVREPYETKRYAKANQDITDISLRVGNVFVLMFPIIMMVLHVATAAVIWFGAQRVELGEINIGGLTAFMQYLLQILMAVMMSVFMVMMLPRAVVSSERIDEVLRQQPSTGGSDPNAVLPNPVRGAVTFDRVSFKYPGAEKPVLKDISFAAKPGQVTAIVGSTGSGKTTLINLIPRLYDADSGKVQIDGVDVATLGRDQIAGHIGLVPQKPFLFSGTIESNLRFGKEDAELADLWHALDIAQGADFVREKPDGLQSRISQGGTNVSGGQRQRLCIARALVAQPQVYLFDDSFSALDVATDARLRAALAPETTQATVIIVAQRVSSITHADQIIVLDDGAVVGIGTHDQLLADNPTYQEIVSSQLTAEVA